jgi:hypothetical protein
MKMASIGQKPQQISKPAAVLALLKPKLSDKYKMQGLQKSKIPPDFDAWQGVQPFCQHHMPLFSRVCMSHYRETSNESRR